MNDFKQTLYEALLVAFGKILAKYNVFAQGSILRDVGKEIIDYLDSHGYEFKESDSLEDLGRLVELFVKNGFAEKLDVEPAEVGSKYTWHNLYGIAAYKELYETADNPFLACPLNLCLYYVADKHNKTIALYEKTFDMKEKRGVSVFDIVDKQAIEGHDFDPLVVENARLYELARDRADRLEKAQKEIKVLRGIIPICAQCKKMRNDEGYWQQLERYIGEHSEALFTHGLCPECVEKYFPEESRKIKEEMAKKAVVE